MTVDRRLVLVLVLALFALLVPATRGLAQEEFDPREAIKEIKKDMARLREDFARLQGDTSTEKAERVIENIDKLLEGLQNSQSGVIGKIDELIRNQKLQDSSSSSSQDPQQGKQKSQGNQGKGQKQPKPQSRDHNQKPGDQKRDEPQDGESKEPGDQPTGKENHDKPEQSERNLKQPDSGTEVVPVIQDAEVWGRLPPEVRQLLIERNYRDYYPNYEKEIADYLKALNRKR
ncbi:MAG: hypothetical protein H6807_02490 [Planctomycetes bacterium]|nr:hypothetical protein [Planctomycetota bacterium]